MATIKYIMIPIEPLLSNLTMDNGKLITVRETMGNINLKEWYHNQYPTDDMWKGSDDKKSLLDVFTLMTEGHDFYNIIGVCDSLIREHVFEKMADVMCVDYSLIYNLWLQSND